MIRHIYTARLLPIGTPVRIPFTDGSPSELQTFTDTSFEIERTSKTKPPIYVNHDANLQIGRMVMLYRSEGWWCTDFALDHDVPDDIVFEVGQPVSVGVQQLKIGSGGTYLQEMSIVRNGAVKGAQITRRFAFEPKPKPAVEQRLPAAVASSDRAAVGEVIHGGQVIRRVFKTPITFRGKHGEVIRNEVDGSQTIWDSKADYRADVRVGMR